MLKFIFWGLLFANAALFAFQLGLLESLFPGGREPARMNRQLNPDQIRIIPPDAPAAMPAVAPVAAPVAVIVACTEVGNFGAEEAKRFEASLAALALGDRLTRRGMREVASHMVYIPSQGDKEAAEKKAGELRRLGIQDFYIIQDNSPYRWGISLGVFKLEEMAQAHLASMNQKGVRTARIGARTVSSNMVAFQLRDLDAEAQSTLDSIKADFPKQEIRTCEPA